MSSGRLAGKASIVTGAGSGIGAAAARMFAREGASVLCVDVDERAAAEVAQTVNDAGGRAVACAADVTSERQMAEMAAAALDAFGTIDVLYANAGVEGVGRAATLAKADWDRVIAIDLTGVWLSARAVMPAMLERRRGSIICQASVAGVTGIPGIAAYAAAKGGVVALVRQMAVDYAAEGIRVNAICPGTVWTPLVARNFRQRAGEDAEFHEQRAKEISAARYPVGRLGEADEIVSVALHLASDESSFTTGAIHVVDGGLSAAGWLAT
jgi:NAD(P)-dependent dehydrogenase (short-subunit alcohol dehydrogenase family)